MAIVMLVFTLAIVLIILIIMRNNFPKLPQKPPQLPAKQHVAILDSTYYNYNFYFSMQIPSTRWKMKILSRDTGLAIADTTQPILSQVKWLLDMERNQDGEKPAIARAGIFAWPAEVNAKDMTIDVLAELLKKYETPQHRAKILVPVSTPAHRIMQGAFFVAVFPKHPDLSYPVWIVSLLPRGNWAYIIIGETTEKYYPMVRDDLQKIVSRFEPISKLKRD
ncbi:MAG: hypothetical protein GWP06_04880 [Actinobacteria bacterium]|nr:hypothetical protein [Actinomycetota bacterium]